MDLTGTVDPVALFQRARERRVPIALRTAGSSRSPRQVIRTTDSWITSFSAVSDLCGLGTGARVWVPGPATASMAVFARVHAAWVGATVVATVREATHAVLTPAALGDLLPVAPSGLVAIVAGDALAPAAAVRARAAGLTVHHYYGAAELSFVAWGEDSGSLRPFPGVELAVRDGEVWVRSPYLCTRYSAQTDGPLRRTADGWATVGDRGALVDGRLTIHGRPDAVNTGGATIQVSEVEAVLRSHATGEVVVVGAAHERLGAVVGAVLTDRSDHRRLVAVSRAKLVAAARPRRWWWADAFPLTDAGKVDRVLLAEQTSTLMPLSRNTVTP